MDLESQKGTSKSKKVLINIILLLPISQITQETTLNKIKEIIK